jgi:multiple sugar transport system substrate-binding protein
MDIHDNQPVATSDALPTAPQAPSAGCSLSRKGFLKGAAAMAGAVAAGPLTGTLARVEAVRPAAPFAGITVRCAFIGGGQYEIMYQSIPLWEKQTGAKVKIVYKGDGFAIDKKLRQDYAAGTVNYDVQWDHTSFFSQYINFLEPHDRYFSASDLSDFTPRILNAGRRDGHLWLIPRHADISALIYRTDLFDDPKEKAAFQKKYGRPLAPPTNWSDYPLLAKWFTRPEKGLYGTQSAGKEEALTGRFYDVLMANGGKFITDGKATFNSPAGVASINMFARMYRDGSMPKDMVNYLWDDVAKNFANGSIAFYTEWYGWYSSFQDPKSSKVAGKFWLMRQPRGTTPRHSGWAGAHGFSIPKAAQHKQAAASLIKFLTSFERAYAEARLGFLPVHKSVWPRLIADASKSHVPLDTWRLKLAQQQLAEDFTTPPLIAQWIPISNILYPKLQAVIVGQADAQTALNDAAEQANAILAHSH